MQKSDNHKCLLVLLKSGLWAQPVYGSQVMVNEPVDW